MMMKYNTIPEFEKDFKKLEKRFNTLPDDFERIKKNAIELYHISGIDNNSVEEIKGIGNTADLKFYKVKKFACLSLKGRGSNTGLRVIYVLFPKLDKVIFLEIYFKGDKENEDWGRIKELIKEVENERTD